MRQSPLAAILIVLAACTPSDEPAATPTVTQTASEIGTSTPLPKGFTEYPVGAGEHPHDVAPSADGRVWYTAQRTGALGLLNPATGDIRRVPLGRGSAPHGVIVGPDGAAWVTDGGLNAIVRVDARTFDVQRFALPRPANANLNTAAFDGRGVLWFTGQAGIYGSLDPRTAKVTVYDAPAGRGPYGIATTPSGQTWFSSLAGSYIALIDSASGRVERVPVPSRGGGARRVWSDSKGMLWVTEWFAGRLARYNPQTRLWEQWRLPGSNPQPYAVVVDERDIVWVTDFGADALVRFDPSSERFTSHPWPTRGAEVRQLLVRPGEVWGAESGTDKLVVFRT